MSDNVNALAARLNELAREQEFLAADFLSIGNASGEKAGALCESRGRLLRDAATTLATLTRERDQWKADGEEWARKLKIECARLDWLEQKGVGVWYPSQSDDVEVSWGLSERVRALTLRAAIDAAMSTPTAALGCQSPVVSCGDSGEEEENA